MNRFITIGEKKTRKMDTVGMDLEKKGINVMNWNEFAKLMDCDGEFM